MARIAGHSHNNCPVCGGSVHYRGAVSVMCSTVGCQNWGPALPGMASKEDSKCNLAVFKFYDFCVTINDKEYRDWESTGCNGIGDWNEWAKFCIKQGVTHVKLIDCSAAFLSPFTSKQIESLPMDDFIKAMDAYFVKRGHPSVADTKID